ncbi:hypothetical protein E2C01_088755 [Portunus trituberculatus]|uniref:Uncharacterized protein n=1 Tax=Portunus trituberculatus TaxID=210409 RepID=A0A5B7J716_PORTR|nr:hypothetical protein [Portunus trituberculatus]
MYEIDDLAYRSSQSSLINQPIPKLILSTQPKFTMRMFYGQQGQYDCPKRYALSLLPVAAV